MTGEYEPRVDYAARRGPVELTGSGIIGRLIYWPVDVERFAKVDVNGRFVKVRTDEVIFLEEV